MHFGKDHIMRLAIIGCGVLGKHHAPCAVQAGFKVVACADPVKANAEALAGLHEGAVATDDCLSVCKLPYVDVVAICTPTHLHTQYVVAAAEAGKHVFCEKPFGRTLEQCEQSLAAVKKAGV